MNPNARREKISAIAKSQNSVNLQELANALNVSKMTLYRDIKYLDNIFISKGNLTYKSNDSFTEFPYHSRKNKNKELKFAVAQTAINYINNNDTIILDGSSTIGYLVSEMIKKNYSLTVATISPIISIELARNNNIEILCPGGSLDNINFIYDCDILNFLETININKAFISCGAFSINNGFTDLAMGESKIKKTIVHKISEINVLVDHTKINKTFSYTWSNYDDVTRVFCDDKVNKNDLNNLKSRKPELIIGKTNFL